ENDDNSSKSVTARFRFEPSSRLRLGNSFYYDVITDPGYNRIVAEGVELEYSKGGVHLVSEAHFGWLRRVDGTTWKQFGWYVQGSYRFAHGLQPYLRIDEVNPIGTPDDGGF